MNNCPKCDSLLIENAKFCSNCGEKVIEEDAYTSSSGNTHTEGFETIEDHTEDEKRNIFKRVKLIISNPKNEWIQVEFENPGVPKMIFGYLLPLALIPLICLIIGYGVIGDRNSIATPFLWFRDMKAGIAYGIGFFTSCILTPIIAAFIINSIAPRFNTEKSLRRTFQLTIYSFTPVMVSGVLFLVPLFSFIAYLGGFYGVVLIMFGVTRIMKTPRNGTIGFFFSTFGILYGLHYIIVLLLRLLAYFIYFDFLKI
jgi:hypothetical protein